MSSERQGARRWFQRWTRCTAILRDPSFLQLLRWCLPALLVGLGLRIAVTVSMPYAFIQYDSSDFFETTHYLLEKGQFHVHYRRSYLTPYWFSLPCLLPVPALITIPLAQHLCGLLSTVLVGALVRLWFRFWKVAIVPITLLFAASPMVAWYEHTVLGETQYLFFALLAVLVGTLFLRRPGYPMLAAFLLSIFLVMGTRLEAKSVCLFGVVLIGHVFWGQWRRLAIGVGALALIVFAALRLGPGRDGSSLTYATLLRFAPDHSRLEPGIAPFLLPLRDDARQRYPDYPGDLVQLDKDVTKMVEAYLQATEKHVRKKRKSAVLRNLCREAAAARPIETLLLPPLKFQLAIDVWSAYAYDLEALVLKQRHSATHRPWMLKLSKRLTGRQCDADQMRAWVDSHYSPVRIAWLGRYQEAWNNARIHLRLPDQRIARQTRWVHDFYGGVPDKHHVLPGIPWFYLVALAGMIVAFFRPARFQWVHIGWIATMLGGLYLSLLIGVTNARYRFPCEIFFILYAGLLFDALGIWWKARCIPVVRIGMPGAAPPPA